MQPICTSTLLLLSLFGAYAKYAYIKEEKTWSEAQEYCQQNYAGLAPISSQGDIVKMMKLVDKNYPLSWVQMEKTQREIEKSMFWGGGRLSGFFSSQDESTGVVKDTISSVPQSLYLERAPFVCYKPVVVMEKKTWEEAWSYCRKHHHMLASVASKAELQLMQRKLSKFNTTERVWIGLHFFPGDGWLWVDSQPLVYEVWGSGGKPQCPKANMECAALKVKDSGAPGVNLARSQRSIANRGRSTSTSGNGSNDPGNGSRESGNGSKESGNGSNDPGNGSNDPGNGSNDPGKGSNEPGNGSKESGNGSNDPGNGSNDPGKGSNEPGNGSKESGNGSKESGNGSNDPGNGSNDPGKGSNEPGNGSNESGNGSNESESGSTKSGDTLGQPGSLLSDFEWDVYGCEEKMNFICY